MATLSRNLKLTLDAESTLPPEGRFTKIVCTIGPKTKSPEMLEKLLDAGMDVMRLNFSHGTHEYHSEVISNLRQVLKKKGTPIGRCAIMLDTKGPEIRTGKLSTPTKTLELTPGQEILVTTDLTFVGDSKKIMIDYQDLATSVKVGGKILIADGQISLSIVDVDAEKNLVKCICDNHQTLGENKNVHLPGAIINLPAVSEKDKADLLFGVRQGVDAVAASFIRTAQDVNQIRAVLGEAGRNIKIISKIESTEGLEKFDSILAVSDGIMVARGDLGVELPLEKIFIAQKMMISKCNKAGKPVITATQMLESMITNPRPTRAESTDVANAVLDGSDAVMLSGETANGDYPIEAVQYMARICREAERVEISSDYPSLFEALKSPIPSVPEVVASYAVRAAKDLKASFIVAITETGTTPRLLCKYRPSVPVLTVTNSVPTANFLLFTRACFPIVVDSVKGTEGLISQVFQRAKQMKISRSGDLGVVVTGTVEGIPGNSNNLRVLTVE
jgi:pyruvate kinase